MAQTQSHPTRASLAASLDPMRIGAGAGTIAINAALLLLMLAPIAPRLVEQPTRDDMHLVPIVTVPPRVEPPPPRPVTSRPSAPPRAARADTTPLPRNDALAVDIAMSIADEVGTDPVQLHFDPPGVAGIGTQEFADIGASLQTLAAPPPPYPRDALLDRLEGTVVLDVHVDVQGRPVDVVIVMSSGHRTLDRAAQRQVLHKWRFRPALHQGRAVPALGRVPVSFVLDR